MRRTIRAALAPVRMRPPEQYGFAQTDARSDVYSLGKLLLFCLTDASCEKQKDAADNLACTQLPPALQDSLKAVVHKATALDPNVRYASAHELMQAFRAAAYPHPRHAPAKLGRLLGNTLIVLFALALAGALVNTVESRPVDQPLWFSLIQNLGFFVMPPIYLLAPLFDPHPLRKENHAFYQERRRTFMRAWYSRGLAVIGLVVIVVIVCAQFVA